MNIRKTRAKACCGSHAYIFQLDDPIKKEHLDIFKKAGYASPDMYFRNGVFYVETKGFIATGSYNTKKLNVKCNSKNCDHLFSMFEKTLENALKG